MASIMHESAPFLSQAETVRQNIKLKFAQCHQILHERESALLSELDEQVAIYKGEGMKEQIEELSQLKKMIKSSFKRNENREAIEKSLAPLDARIRDIELNLERAKGMKRVDLEWDEGLEKKLGGIGTVKVHQQENIGYHSLMNLNNAVFKLEQKSEDYIRVENTFKGKWNPNRGVCPPISAIFKINCSHAETKFNQYVKTLRHENANSVEHYYHGCKITCDLLHSESLCNRDDCTICQICKQGFDIKKAGTNVAFTRFGRGLFFCPESSKCHDYALGVPKYGYRAMLYVKCAPGFKQVQFVDNSQRTSPDKGYDSLYGLAGGNLNYDELCLYNDSACVPKYLIIYFRDGVYKRCF